MTPQAREGGETCDLNPGHAGWIVCPVHGAELQAQLRALPESLPPSRPITGGLIQQTCPHCGREI